MKVFSGLQNPSSWVLILGFLIAAISGIQACSEEKTGRERAVAVLIAFGYRAGYGSVHGQCCF